MGNTKATAETPAIDIFAYVNGQGTRFAAPDVHTASTDVEAPVVEPPTLLRSVTREQVKSVASTAPDPIVSLVDIELGDAGKQSRETDTPGAVTDDFDNWLANCDIANMKIPDIPKTRKTEAGNSAV